MGEWPRLQVATWRLLVEAGNSPRAIAEHAGTGAVVVEEQLARLAAQVGPARALDGRSVPIHQARLALRTALDRLDRSGGLQACWPVLPAPPRSGHGHAGQALLGTTSWPRRILMVTSGVLRAAPGQVAAHTCHAGEDRCGANPAHLRWASIAGNNSDRRWQRLATPIAPRPPQQIRHLDVLDRPVDELGTLAKLEKVLLRVRRAANGCLHVAGLARGEYTCIWLDGHNRVLHRVLVELASGRPVPAQLHVGHADDNKGCLRLDHLELLTPARNTRDAYLRGLAGRGEKHARATLSDHHAAQILQEAAAQTMSAATLAARWGVSDKTIADLLLGHSYRHVPGPRRSPHRRLSDSGVRVVRSLTAFGVPPHTAARQLWLTPRYVTELACGGQRAKAGGTLIPPPGPACGVRVATAALTGLAVAYARHRRTADGVGWATLGRMLGVDPSTVARAVRRATWQHVSATS